VDRFSLAETSPRFAKSRCPGVGWAGFFRAVICASLFPAQLRATSLMKNLIGIILIVAGIFVFIQGMNRRDSLAGQVDRAGTAVANTVDGGARQPKHIVYMVVGGVLVIGGIGVISRRARPTSI
jgi:hypothetical protein